MKSCKRLVVVLTLVCLLAACGFHLRRNADLPDGMEKVHLSVAGNRDFKRSLSRSLLAGGTDVVERKGPDVARMHVTDAGFRQNALTVTGQGRINEYAVYFRVAFNVKDADGNVIVKPQKAEMSRNFTYDASDSKGRTAQIEALKKSLIKNMVRSVISRLQAAGKQSRAQANGEE